MKSRQWIKGHFYQGFAMGLIIGVLSVFSIQLVLVLSVFSLFLEPFIYDFKNKLPKNKDGK